MIVSNFPPHEKPGKDDIRYAQQLMKSKHALLVRYTSDFDCGFETEWWYIIKDEPDDISALKSSVRYEITKGITRNNVNKIDPGKCIEEMFQVYNRAYRRYKMTDKHVSRKTFFTQINSDSTNCKIDYFGVFSRRDGKLVGYSRNIIEDKYVSYSMIKLDPEYLNDGSSAALLYNMNEYYLVQKKKNYILDGERSIRHDTNIQVYLEKYFQFRKAFCTLHVIYNPFYRPLVFLFWLTRKQLKEINKILKLTLLNNAISLALQENIRRNFIHRSTI